MDNSDIFLSQVLFKNHGDFPIVVEFPFLENAYDMFIFFLHILSKSLCMLLNKTQINLDQVCLHHIEYIRDRFKHCGIIINIDVTSEPTPIFFASVYIDVQNNGKQISDFALVIKSYKIYRISFGLKRITIGTPALNICI